MQVLVPAGGNKKKRKYSLNILTLYYKSRKTVECCQSDCSFRI